MFLRLLKIINWFLTRQKSSPIVEEATSEKIIVETTTEDIVAYVREWSLNRIADKSIVKGDAKAILAEFYEWIDPEDTELEIISLHA
jgi:hypothetical protein